MDKKFILSPSILAADFSALGDGIRTIDENGAEYVHIDVMDGHFVPSISFGFPIIESIRPITKRVFDVHLMISEPQEYIEEFAKVGADIITVHLETLKYPLPVFEKIRELGCKVGLAINPETSVHALEPFLDKVDMILIMTVRPGFGGQKYLDYCTEKVIRVRHMLTERGLSADIEVDGGIGKGNIEEIMDAGANVIVMGSSVFRGDIQDNVRYYQKLMQERNKTESN